MSRNYFQQTVCRADSWRYLHFSQQSVRLFASLSVTRLIINKHNAHLKNTNFKFQFFCYFSCVLLWRRCFGVVLCFFLFVCFFKTHLSFLWVMNRVRADNSRRSKSPVSQLWSRILILLSENNWHANCDQESSMHACMCTYIHIFMY